MRILLAALFVCGLALPAEATTYYADHTITDCATYNPATRSCTGGSSIARDTIQQCVDLLVAGDTCLVRGPHSYTESILNDASFTGGSSWATKTTLAAYPGNCKRDGRPVDGNDCEAVTMNAVAGWTTDRIFEFGTSGTGQKYIEINGITIDGTNVEFEPIKINYDPTFSQVAHHIRFQSNVIIGSTNNRTAGQSGIQTVSGDSTTIGFNEIINNEIKQIRDYALYIAGPDTLIEYNWMHDLNNNTTTTSGGGVHIYNGDTTGSPVMPDRTIVRYNVVNDVADSSAGAWCYIQARGSGNQIYGNLCYDMRATGSVNEDACIMLFNGTAGYVANNTCYGSADEGIVVYTSNATVVNNISVNNASNDFRDSGSGTTKSNNICDSGCNINDDPEFTNAAGDDFTLQSTSPARDAGTNTSATVTSDLDDVSRPQGSAVDIGAYEFNEVGEGGSESGGSARRVTTFRGVFQ